MVEKYHTNSYARIACIDPFPHAEVIKYITERVYHESISDIIPKFNVILRMLQPLTLVPPRSSTIQLTEMFSPTQRNRADSLVFSITSQKYRSPKDSILLESRSEEVCKELEELQYKLQSLESKVQVFNTEPMIVDTRDQTMQYRKKDESRRRDDFENTDPNNYKENIKNLSNVGKIVKKDQSLAKTTKIVRTNSKSKA